MNQYPILLNIAYHCDFSTLLNFMLVNKKSYKVFKYIIHTSPTIFIVMYFVETNGVLPNKIIYNSLCELFTKLHQFELKMKINYSKYCSSENIDGPCSYCLKDNEFCYCNDLKYLGIKMVKYISTESKEDKMKILNSSTIKRYDCRLTPLSISVKGFRMSIMLNDLYDDKYSKNINYNSMEYLYFGCNKASHFTKYGIKIWNPNKFKYYNMYYPLTTDIIQFLSFDFAYYFNLKSIDFKKQYAIKFTEFNSKYPKIRINTI